MLGKPFQLQWLTPRYLEKDLQTPPRNCVPYTVDSIRCPNINCEQTSSLSLTDKIPPFSAFVLSVRSGVWTYKTKRLKLKPNLDHAEWSRYHVLAITAGVESATTSSQWRSWFRVRLFPTFSSTARSRFVDPNMSFQTTFHTSTMLIRLQDR